LTDAGSGAIQIWFWSCPDGCGSRNVREVPAGTRGGELLDCSCAGCGGHSVLAVEPAALAFDRRAARRDPRSAARQAVVAIDNDSRVTYWGAGAVWLYGVPVREALGSPLSDCYTVLWTRPDDLEAMLASLAARGVASGRSLHVRRSGEKLDVEWIVNEIRDGAGARTGLLAVIHAVSENRLGGKNDEAERPRRRPSSPGARITDSAPGNASGGGTAA